MFDLNTLFVLTFGLWIFCTLVCMWAWSSSRTYVALSFVYFLRSKKFTPPSKFSRLRLELTPPAFFLFFAGLGTTTMYKLGDVMMLDLGTFPGGIDRLLLTSLLVGAGLGGVGFRVMTIWGRQFIHMRLLLEGQSVDRLLLRFVATDD